MSDYIYKDRVDWALPVQTRDGRKAYFVDRIPGHIQPCAVMVVNPQGHVIAERVYESGQWTRSKESALDIINALPAREVRRYWANIYERSAALHLSERDAKNARYMESVIACVPVTIEFRPGEGL